MCLILFAIKAHPRYRLIIAGNRDEFYDRPTAKAAFWEGPGHVLAGRDLLHGGTWFGLTRYGRIAAITNYRDPASFNKDAPSRGGLVTDFLLGHEPPLEYLDRIALEKKGYNGFNLIIGDKDQLRYYSNRDRVVRPLGPGIHGLSNRLLDTAWPKILKGKGRLKALLEKEKGPLPDELFNLLSDREIADDKSLPDTGVTLEWERILSPIFISSPTYGTRSSSVLLIDMDNRVNFIERTFNEDPDNYESVNYEFSIGT